ncbi:MAG: hypothetical protein LBB13_01705 [Rickettsiales bacterium]|jgi:hypothetical protein|nr:hypothetical protein [Rickettsiales bacterium]
MEKIIPLSVSEKFRFALMFNNVEHSKEENSNILLTSDYIMDSYEAAKKKSEKENKELDGKNFLIKLHEALYADAFEKL